jgi:hypothetical protein
VGVSLPGVGLLIANADAVKAPRHTGLPAKIDFLL